MKCSATLFLVLAMASSVLLAQTAKTTATSPTKVEPAVENSQSKADELREHQLRVFREQVLARALDGIKKMDEAGLRISARNQLLTYLANDKAPSDEKQTLATQVARDALTDLREHNEEINPFMFSYLSNDLRSWLQKHRPSLIEDFDKTIEANLKADTAQHIRSLFELEGGDVLAARRIRQELEDRSSLNGLNFWLDELLRRNSREFEPVASDVVARAGQGQISFETLFWISDIYLRPQVSNALRNRFLTTVVALTQPANFITEPAPQPAYDLLTRLLPVIQRSTSELYDEAQNNSFAMRASLNERQLASEARVRRLKESVDPISDLRSDAEAAKSKTERNELLLQAAQLALEKKKLDVCLDIAAEVDVNVAAKPDFWQRAIDQILRNVVRAAISGKLPEMAEKGAARITSPLTRVEALILIMRYYAKANDKEDSQRLLIEAAKVAASGPENTDKAKAFFVLSVGSDQVDVSKKTDLLLSGIKVLNTLSRPDSNARDKTVYQTYVQRLDNSGYELTKGFKGLTKRDENDALALVERLNKPDLRTFALIGILEGLDGLIAETPSQTKN